MKRHRWSKVSIGSLIGPNPTLQVCKDCGIYRINAYCGTIRYLESDGVTRRLHAGPCKPINKTGTS